MIAVVDTSVLIALARISKLGLLNDLFSEVLIPSAVRSEILAAPLRVGAGEVLDAIDANLVRIVDPTAIDERLEAGLGAGEGAVISLAVELGQAVSVVLDDLGARRAALRLGLDQTGTLGILISARDAGLIPRLSTLVNELQKTGFHMSQGLIERTVSGDLE